MTGYAIPIGGGLTFTARQDRQARSALWTPGASGLQVTAGVRPGPGLDVSVAGSTITVTPGSAIVQSAASSVAGPYEAWTDANFTTALTAADATNPRSDLVYLRVRDTDEDGSGSRDCTPVYLAGTPAASPVTPTIPVGTSGIVLGVITVPKVGAGSPTVSYSTRPYSVAAGGIMPVQSGLLAGTGVYIGQTRYNLSRGLPEYWNGTAWAAQGDWANYTVIWSTASNPQPALGSGTITGRWTVIGRTPLYKIEMATASNTTFGTGQMSWSLPFTSSGAGTGVSIGQGHAITPGVRWDIQGLITSTQSTVNILAPGGSGDCRLFFLSSTQSIGGAGWGTNITIRLNGEYEMP